MVRLPRVELGTFRVGGEYSIQLNYRRVILISPAARSVNAYALLLDGDNFSIQLNRGCILFK